MKNTNKIINALVLFTLILSIISCTKNSGIGSIVSGKTLNGTYKNNNRPTLTFVDNNQYIWGIMSGEYYADGSRIMLKSHESGRIGMVVVEFKEIDENTIQEIGMGMTSSAASLVKCQVTPYDKVKQYVYKRQ